MRYILRGRLHSRKRTSGRPSILPTFASSGRSYDRSSCKNIPVSPYCSHGPSARVCERTGVSLYRDKGFLLWGLGITASAIFVYLALSGRPFFYQRLRNKATWIPLALLAVEYGTSFVGIDFYHSFWGLFERGDGLLTSTIITLFFYLILPICRPHIFGTSSENGRHRASIVASIAVLQWVTTMLSEKVWFHRQCQVVSEASFGNAAFLAGYLGMSLFVILLVLRDSVGLWRRFLQAAAILSILAIVLAATRAYDTRASSGGVAGLLFVAIKGAEEWKRSGALRACGCHYYHPLSFSFSAPNSQGVLL